jgi:tetratricopeptide (TPR) repeat protein
MRVGIIAAATGDDASNPVIGERDALLVRERLALEDMGFQVHSLDPSSDMAHQVDVLLADHGGQLDQVLMYVSARLVTLEDGECFVCLDLDNPNVGDSVRDVVVALSERSCCPVLMVLEARHAATDVQGLRDAAMAVRDAVDSPSTGIEAIVSVRSVGAHPERIPSRFTAGFLEEIDGRDGPLVAKQVYASVVQHADLGSWPHAELYASGTQSVSLRDPSRYPVSSLSGTGRGPVSSDRFRSASMSDDGPKEPPPPPVRAPKSTGAEPPPPPVRAPKTEAAAEPPPPPVRAAKSGQAELVAQTTSADVPVFIPPPVPVPSALLAGAAEAAAETKSGRKKDEPRRAAPPSERADAATVTLSTRRKQPKPEVEAALPKVVIDEKVDPRKRPTLRKIDVDVKAMLADAGIHPKSAPQGETASEESEAPPVSVELLPESRATLDAAPTRPSGAMVGTEVSAPPPPKRPAKTLVSETDDGWDVERSSPTTVERASVTKVERTSPTTVERTSNRGAEVGSSAATDRSSRPSSARAQKKVTEWTVDEHMAAGDEHFERGEVEQSLGEFKKALGKLGSAPSPMRAELYVRIAEVNRRQKNSRLALTNFEKALAIVPDLARAHAGVLACHVDQKNWKAVQAAEEKLLATLPPEDERRLESLLEFAERAATNDARERALSHLLLANQEFPADRRPLDRLLSLHEADGHDAEAMMVRRKLVEFIEHPGERAQALFELGESCMEAGDEEEALRLFELVLDADPGCLEALEQLAATLADNQEWAELERIYRKMIDAYRDEADGPSRSILCELHRKLALLFRDHLEDPEQALAALDDDLALRPDDTGGLLLAAELSLELENHARALLHLRRVTQLEPLNVEAYRKLFELGQRFDDAESTFLASSVLRALGASTPEQAEVYEANAVQGVPAHRRPLRPEAWLWFRDKTHDIAIDGVMRALAPAVIRARVRHLEEKKKLPALPERHDPKTSTASVVRTIGWASQFLGVEAPAIYLDDKIDTPMSARFAKHQALIVGKGAMRGRSMGELAFFAGRHLALCLPENELLPHMHSIDELTACLLAGIKLTLGAAPSGPLAAVVDTLAGTLATQLDDEERGALDRAVRRLTARNTGQIDLTAWVAAVERSATRAGFVLCGDLGLAIKLIEAEGDSAFSSARSRIADLCAFAISSEHMKLRQEFGSSLIEDAELPRLPNAPPPSL